MRRWWQFCSTAFGSGYDGRAAIDYIKETAKEPVRIGFAAMAIPVSRGEIDSAEAYAKSVGMTTVDKEVIPPPTPDYTPFATKLKDATPNWVFSWAPWVTQVKTFEALRRLGWQGEFIAWGHLEAEAEMARLKDDKFYVLGANSLSQDGLPIHKEIAEAAKAGNIAYPAEQITEGWVAGLVIEAALKGISGAPDGGKMAASLSTVNVDTKGLRGGPLEWAKDNHFRTKQYYRVYRWDSQKNAVARVKDWFGYDVK
jgi:branched-chain amino acid transport system substrate-binding protein